MSNPSKVENPEVTLERVSLSIRPRNGRSDKKRKKSNALGKSQCSVCGQWFDDSELDDHLNQHLEGPAEEPGTVQKRLMCPTCDKVMDAYYGVPFRVGGTGPGMRLLLGAWAELGEEPIPIDIYVCPQYGRIEQFATKDTRDRLRRSAPHKP